MERKTHKMMRLDLDAARATWIKEAKAPELRVSGQPLNQSVHGNDFWQTDYDAATGRWSNAFNLPRNDDKPLHIAFGPVAARARTP